MCKSLGELWLGLDGSVAAVGRCSLCTNDSLLLGWWVIMKCTGAPCSFIGLAPRIVGDELQNASGHITLIMLRRLEGADFWNSSFLHFKVRFTETIFASNERGFDFCFSAVCDPRVYLPSCTVFANSLIPLGVGASYIGASDSWPPPT